MKKENKHPEQEDDVFLSWRVLTKSEKLVLPDVSYNKYLSEDYLRIRQGILNLLDEEDKEELIEQVQDKKAEGAAELIIDVRNSYEANWLDNIFLWNDGCQKTLF